MKNITWYKIFDSLEEANLKISLQKTILLRAGKHEICLGRTEKGFFAVQNHCPHQHESLHQGWLNTLDEIICPLHFYRFNLRNGQEMTGKNCPDLFIYPLKITEEGLFLGLK